MFEKWNQKESLRRAKFTANLLGNLNGKLLDIGAYKGELSKFLPNIEYYPLDVYDLKKEFKNAVKQNLNEDTNLSFKDNFFDYVVFIGTLEHLFFPEKILKEINRILKSDGFAIISFPNDNNWYWKLVAHTFHNLDMSFDELKFMHHWFFGEKSSQTLLQKYFKIISKSYYNGIYGRFIPFAKSEIFYKVVKP